MAWSSASTARSGSEHLYPLEIASRSNWTDESEAYRTLCNKIRPHEALQDS